MMASSKGTRRIDWERRWPIEHIEGSLSSTAYIKTLGFLSSMKSVAPEYASEEARDRLRRIVFPIALNVWDGYLTNTDVTLAPDSETLSYLGGIGADWRYLTIQASAFAQTGIFNLAYLDPVAGEDSGYRLVPGPNLHENIKRLKSEVLDHSEPLDRHVHSDHPEANAFVDRIWKQHFGASEDIEKRHIKVLLLDLYVRWLADPSMKTGVHRDSNAYATKSRYNKLHISRLTPRIADCLEEVGLVLQAPGYHGQHSEYSGRTSRIWPTPKLVRMFQEAKFGALDIEPHPDRETIILRERRPGKTGGNIDVEYIDTRQTQRMRAILNDYNALLRRTFIDIPTLDSNVIKLEPGPKGQRRRLSISQRDKFVRRIFSRNSFKKGGRFYGGWWQRCPKQYRQDIFINDSPTIEIDYSGLHIVMLYAAEGIDYWKEIGTDPYALALPDSHWTPDEIRSLCKSLLLVALNAKDERETFQAFRNKADDGSWEKHLGDDKLTVVLDALREKHPKIAGKFASDAGIDLMNQDAKIVERLIEHFTDLGIPILTIHDSFIAPIQSSYDLEAEMRNAFEAMTGAANVKSAVAWEDDIHVFAMPKSKMFDIPGVVITKERSDPIPRFYDRYLRERDRFERRWKNE